MVAMMLCCSCCNGQNPKTIKGEVKRCEGESFLTGFVWTWSLKTKDSVNYVIDGTTHGNPTSYTASDYGEVQVKVDFFIGTTESMLLGSITLRDPKSNQEDDEKSGPVSEDVFALKPIIIQPECTGDISITASIVDLIDKAPVVTEGNSTSANASVCFTDIELAGGETLEIEVNSTGLVSGNATIPEHGNKLIMLKYIPAFYNSGYINAEYTVGETESEEGEFDVTWDMKIMCPDAEFPQWYEGNLSYDSKIFDNLITSSQTETKYPGAAVYTSMPPPQWYIANWLPGLPPFWIRWWVDYNKDTADQVAVKRACLPDFTYKFIIKNNITSAVKLNNASITWNFSFSESGKFMNMRTAGDRGSERASIFTLPKGAGATRNEGMNFPIYGLIEGYEDGEIVKVYGVFSKWEEKIEAYYPKTVLLEAIPKDQFGDVYTGDFGIFMYKGSNILPYFDWNRIVTGTWMSGDKIDVITPQRIAAEPEFKIIKVDCETSVDAEDAIITIAISPNESIDSKVTAEELQDNIATVHYFNTAYEFATYIEVPRSEIAAPFRETLWKTYEDAVVCESVLDEPLHYLNFSVNDYPEYIPIYHGQTLSFSDRQTHCIDGVRSTDIFVMDGITPNIINVKNPDKHKYKFKFDVKYDIYKHIHVVNDEDLERAGIVFSDDTEE